MNSFLLWTWDPMGAKMSKLYCPSELQLKLFKILYFPLRGKTAFWIFETEILIMFYFTLITFYFNYVLLWGNMGPNESEILKILPLLK